MTTDVTKNDLPNGKLKGLPSQPFTMPNTDQLFLPRTNHTKRRLWRIREVLFDSDMAATRTLLAIAELVFANGLSASASYIDGGVRIDYRPEHWDFVDAPGDEAAARAWFTAHAGRSYDLMGNLSFLCPLIPDSKRKWFCSEACAAALGIPEPHRMGPNGLAAVLRWEGWHHE